MQKLSKLMLVAVAAIALATPAMAWDFGVTGSSSATFNMKTDKKSSSADPLTTQDFGSDAGAITITSSHTTDGGNTVKFSYGLDWDGNLDEVATVSGTTKVGDWTASSSIDYNRDDGAQTAADAPSITLTDGKMTIIMGSAAHLGAASNIAGSGAVGGQVDWQAYGEDLGANVGTFQGVSLGYGINDTSSVTVALQMDTGAAIFGRGVVTSIGAAVAAVAGDVTFSEVVTYYNANNLEDGVNPGCGDIDNNTAGTGIGTGTTGSALACYNTWAAGTTGQMVIDNATAAATAASTAAVQTTGFGLNYTGAFGTTSVGFTYASGSSKSADSDVKATAKHSTMSLSVGMDMGNIDPFFTYANYKATTNAGTSGANDAGTTGTGMGLGTSVTLNDTDSIVVAYTTTTANSVAAGSDANTETGLELGYKTTVGGGVTLEAGYGSYSMTGDGGPYRIDQTIADADEYGKGGSTTDIGVKLAYSF
jgi:hypothetical protein